MSIARARRFSTESASTDVQQRSPRQMPELRCVSTVDAGVEVAAILLGALQDDRSRCLGERALSPEDIGGAG